MELNNDFRVSVPPAQAWGVLTDVERIAPLLPGAQLQEVEGDEYRGVVKVKVGPITAQYKGTARWQERDETAHKAVLKASGRDTRGQGNASATIAMSLAPDGEGTKVAVVTDLTITGKVAQFGRGVLADVSSKLLGQFVDALEADLEKEGQGAAPSEPAAGGDTLLAAPAGAEAAPAAPPSAPSEPGAGAEAPADGEPAGAEPAGAEAPAAGPRRIEHPEAKPVDLVDVAGGSVAKRLLPALGGVLILLLVILRRARRR